MVTLIRTVIGGAAVTGGGVCTLAVSDPDDDSQAQAYLDNVEAFWTETAVALDSNVTFQVEGNPARYAASTGELQQIFSADGSGVITGGVSGQAVPRAAQALIRWHTADIVNGRSVRGRTFVPGIPASQLTDAGGLASDFVTQLRGEAEELLADTGGSLVVWHRPVNGAGGSEHLVTSASVWDQFAMLTSRRD